MLPLASSVASLLSDTWQELSKLGYIKRRVVDYYSSLYSREWEEDNTLSERFCSKVPQASAETKSLLDQPLQIGELQSMQGWRVPGTDELNVEFFKAFWDFLAPDILNKSLVSGSLSKKSNLQNIKNWHPVFLLCVDYKILPKALANRLRIYGAGHLLYQDQTYPW